MILALTPLLLAAEPPRVIVSSAPVASLAALTVTAMDRYDAAWIPGEMPRAGDRQSPPVSHRLYEGPMSAPIEKTFRALLGGEAQASLPVIEVPFDVKRVFGKARAPVVITINGFSFRSTVAVYGGKSLVGIRKECRVAAKVKIGQMVEITLRSDDAPREVELPEDFAAAIKSRKGAAGWAKLSYTARKEHVEAIESAKKPETRARRIERALSMLEARK
jgi:hypothetical protein